MLLEDKDKGMGNKVPTLLECIKITYQKYINKQFNDMIYTLLS